MKRLSNITIIKKNLKRNTIERLKERFGYKTQKDINNCPYITKYFDNNEPTCSDELFDYIHYQKIVYTLWKAFECDNLRIKMFILSNIDNLDREMSECMLKEWDKISDVEPKDGWPFCMDYNPQYDMIIVNTVMDYIKKNN